MRSDQTPGLGPYVLELPLGRGGMGTVWTAAHRASGAFVAIKVIGESGTAAQREALRREVRAIAGLDHPNVVAVFDHGVVPDPAPEGVVPGSPWLAMELAQGDLHGRRPTSWLQIRKALLDVLHGLAHVHARGLIHRDLKPENVLAVGGGWKLADLGIAHALRDLGDSARSAGSPAYMAPEQLLGELERQGPASDLYAVGCVGWELATGLPPFARSSVTDVARAHLHEALPVFEGGPVPESFEGWLRSLLAKDPGRRPAFAADVAQALLALPDAEIEAGEVAFQRAPATTWSTLAAAPTDEVARDWDSDEVRTLPPATPPSDWRQGAVHPAQRPHHGAELALAGLRSPPLFGRSDAQDALWESLLAVRAEGRARAVVVTGPSGIGRTALLRWLAERAVETGAARVWLRSRGGGDPLPSPDQLRGDRPALLLLDDLLSDPDGLRLAVRYLSGRSLEQIPVLVVAAESSAVLASDEAREAFGSVCRAAGSGLHTLDLGVLDDADVEALLHNVVRLDESAARRMIELVGGSPRATVELVAALVRAGAVELGPDGYRVASEAAFDASVALGRSSLRQLDDLLADRPEQDGFAVEMCAAVGMPMAFDAWAALFGAADLAPSPDLDDLLLDSGLADGTSARWGLVRGTLRAAIQERAREAGRWARWCEIAAGHLAEDRSMGRHVGRLWFEAERYRECLAPLLDGRVAYDTARGVLAALELRAEALRRLEIPDSDPLWAVQFEQLCSALHSRGRLVESRRWAEHLLVEARKHGWVESEGIALGAIGGVALLQGGDSVAPTRRAYEILDRHGTGPHRANARLMLISALTHGQLLDEALEHAEAWVLECESQSGTLCVALRSRGLVRLFRGDVAGAESDSRESYELDLAAGRWNAAGFSAQYLGMIGLDREDPEAGGRSLREAIELHLRSGNLYGARNALLNLADCRLRAGALDEAGTLTNQAVDLGAGLGADALEGALVLVDLALRRNDRDLARGRLPEADGYSRTSRLELLLRDRALRSWLALPDEAEWRRWHEDLVGVLSGVGYVPSSIPAVVERVALAWAALGRSDLGREAAEVALVHLDRNAPDRARTLRAALA